MRQGMNEKDYQKLYDITQRYITEFLESMSPDMGAEYLGAPVPEVAQQIVDFLSEGFKGPKSYSIVIATAMKQSTNKIIDDFLKSIEDA